jgi:hypothetical protein
MMGGMTTDTIQGIANEVEKEAGRGVAMRKIGKERAKSV